MGGGTGSLVDGNPDRLSQAFYFYPRSDLPQLPIDTEIIKAIKEGAERGLETSYVFFLNCPPGVAALAKQRQVNLFYSPEQPREAFLVADDRDLMICDSEGATGIKNSLFKVTAYRGEFGKIPKIRVLPEHVDWLMEQINALKKILADYQGNENAGLSKLEECRLHPVNIFYRLAQRYGIEGQLPNSSRFL